MRAVIFLPLILLFTLVSSRTFSAEIDDSLQLKVNDLKILSQTDPYTALNQSNLLFKECTAVNYYSGIATIEDIRGTIYLNKNDFSRARESFERGLIISKEHNLNTRSASIYSNLGVLNYLKGDYDEAIRFFKKGLDLDGITNEVKANLYTNVAVLTKDNLHKYEESITYLKKAEELYEKNRDKARTFRYIGMTYLKIDKLKESEDNLLQAIKLLENDSDYLLLSGCYNSILETYWTSGQFDKVDEIIGKSDILFPKLDSDKAKIEYYATKAEVYRQLGQFEKAIDINKHILSQYNELENYINIHIQNELYLNLKAINRHEEALYYLEKSKAFSDSVQEQELLKEAHETFSQIELIEEKKENDILEAKIASEKKQKMWTILFISVIIILLLSLIILQFSRYKRKRLIAEKDNELLRLENLNKHNEINIFSQRLSEKNILIEQFQERLKELDKQEDFDQETLKNLKLEISELKISTDKDWHQFKSIFEAIEPGFIDRLKQNHPGLSNAEERLSLLFKLEYSNSHISDVLGISKESVVKGKYRLKVKLNLHEDMHADEYIRNL